MTDPIQNVIDELLPYVGHTGNCAVPPWERHNAPDCTCGLRATLERVKNIQLKAK